MGAKKVVVYEPTKRYCQFITKNIALNHVNADVNPSGIGEADTIMVMEPFDLTSKNRERPRKEIVKLKNAADVITESGADIAKIDCGGAEVCLVKVPNETLRKIRYYILELHGEETRKTYIKVHKRGI